MARYCGKCGTEIVGSNTYCTACGANQNEPENVAETGPTITSEQLIWYYEKDRRDRNAMIAAGVVAAIVIMAGIGYFVSVGNQAYIAWDVESTHFAYNVDVIVYVDGKQVSSWENLKPGQGFYNKTYYVYRFSMLDDSKLITVKAVSTGGGIGSQIDSKNIIVKPGGKYTVNLYV